MAIRRLVLFGVCAFAALVALPRPSVSQVEKAPLKIAVIDIDQIRRDALVVKDIRGQVSQLREGFQTEIQREEEALRNANQELARQRTILSPEAFAEERRKFEQRLVVVQRMVQQRKQELQKTQGEAMEKVESVLNDVVTKVAQELGLTLILRKSQTVLVASHLNVTNLVLERLDQDIPSLKISSPGK